MSVARKSAVSAQRVRPLKTAVSSLKDQERSKRSSSQLTAVPHRTSSSTVHMLPRSPVASPPWLLRLCELQRRSTVVTFLLVGAVLTVYGGTVYCQQMWSQSYRKLVTLQIDERQLTTTNEMLKENIALQAEQPATELLPLNPAALIFLTPTPERPSPAANPVSPASKAGSQTKQLSQTPLGY